MQAYIVCYIFRLHGVFLAAGGPITSVLRRIAVRDSARRSRPQNFPPCQAARKGHWSCIAGWPEECHQQVGQLRKPFGLAAPKALDLPQPPFGSSCPGFQPPPDPCDTRRAGGGRRGVWRARLAECSATGEDALGLEILSKNQNEVK